MSSRDAGEQRRLDDACRRARRRRGRAAPPSTASRSHSSTRSASPASISGPTSVASSSGSPTTSVVEAARELVLEAVERLVRRRRAAPRCTSGRRSSVAAPDDALRRVRGVGVGVRRSTAALPPSSSVTRFGPARLFSAPADGGLPVKRQQLDAVVLDERRRVVRSSTARRRSPPPASPPRARSRASLSALIGVWLAGRSTIGLPGGERRRDLVRDEVEREVERRDPGDRPERDAAHVADAALGAGQPVERHDLAVDPLRLLGGDAERERGAVDLDARRLDRLARLERDRAREVVALRPSIAPAIRARISARRHDGSFRVVLERAHGAGDRALDLLRAGAVDDGDERVVVRAAHLVRCRRLGASRRRRPRRTPSSPPSSPRRPPTPWPACGRGSRSARTRARPRPCRSGAAARSSAPGPERPRATAPASPLSAGSRT